MSASAGTPHAPSSKVARVGGVSLEPSPAGGVALEPSPGSTYGESVTSNVTDASALPPTPTDGMSSLLLHVLIRYLPTTYYFHLGSLPLHTTYLLLPSRFPF